MEVDVRLGEFRLVGRVENIYAGGLLHFRYATVKPGDRLRIWIHHLVLNKIGDRAYPCNGILAGKDLDCKYPPIKDSEALLQDLIEAYWQGLMKPIPFFPRSSWEFVESLAKGKDQARQSARNKWRGSDFSPGEGEDPYFQVCFEHGDPLNEEFEEWSKKIFEPLISCEEKIKNG